MTGTKTNERPGVRAQHRHARFSATKAREVLDLIRGKSVGEARTILQFCDRGAAEPIAKVLDSAVANAANNNDIPPEELFVATAYADEGPTLKRWRPRARGRATRIRKRTCHITIIVGRYSVEDLDRIRSRQARTGRNAPDASANRARRVARSRSKESAAEPAEETTESAEALEDAHDAEATEEVVKDSSAETAEDATAGKGADTGEPSDAENAADAEATHEVVKDSSAEQADDAVADDADDAGAENVKKDED
jgi:large subunit ribosomal protein L22